MLYEGPALELWQKWLGERPSLAIGPIYTDPQVEEHHAAQILPPEAAKLMQFMDHALDKCGEHSVIYVSSCIAALARDSRSDCRDYASIRCPLGQSSGLPSLRRSGLSLKR